MTTVALVVHPDRPEAKAIAERATTWLEARGGAVTVVGDAALDLAEPAPDLAVSLGGDGTMLRTVALATPRGVPVLGVNLGRLGYLTEVEPPGLERALERFVAGDYQIEERMTLEVTVTRGSEERPATARRSYVALNEAVVEKTVPGHTVRLAAAIAGRPFVTYAADGLLVATPTGSTAYNLSARGPIVSPRLRAIVVTPISPHMLFDRPLVLEPEEWIRLEVAPPRAGVLVVDGQTIAELEPGDAVEARAGAVAARVVTFGGRDFHAILRARFHLADR
ncbi:MAG TPA: NAD(+)/NADH kinase [Acidimicrobiales bacterium]|nr:NAD(+)/NADH kinase [Acidimicrobiales bacterium]